MTLKRTFDVTVTLLAPLHIGTGRELMLGYDYAVRNKQTWMLNADVILDDKARVDAQGRFVDAQGRPDDRVLRLPPAELLDAADFDAARVGPGKLFRYTLPGAPRSAERGAVLREQMKDVFGQPYLPGSSLKGALRTLLAWYALDERRVALPAVEGLGSRSWAARETERTLFGPNPNHDLLRALHVADSRPVGADRLFLVNAQVVTGSEKMGAPIELEALRPDTAFTTTVTLDEYLHSERAAALRFGEHWAWLEQLPAIGRAWALQQLSAERAWFQSRKYERIAGLYGQMVALLQTNKVAGNRFFAQVGWGAGWGAKTFGARLSGDKEWFERLLGGKTSPARFRRRPGDLFPKSRRVMVQNGQPVAPFGWCLIEMKERR
jgi:CRISPR-associated protein Csm5